MSIQVPNDQALSLEHRKYLEMMGQNDRVTYLDQQFPPDEAEQERIARWKSGLPETDLRPIATIGNPGQLYLKDVSDEDLLAEVERREREANAEDNADEEDEPYEQWTAAELRTDAVRRGLSDKGTKAELIARLEENDQAQVDAGV